jgi:5'-3' exonuclease
MKVHLVDGTFELFRAHFTKRPPHRDPEGRDAKATQGILWSMLTLLKSPAEGATHLGVAFDNPIRSFRNELYAGYKTEEGVAAELLAQFDRAEEGCAALGLVVWRMDRWEADDALATAAARFAPEVEQVRILTPDKDLGQCIEGTRVVQVDVIRKRVVDETALRARRGIGPSQIPDWLALVGDAADGYPGLPGFGEKTATALLAAFGHLEEIPLDSSRWPLGLRGSAILAATLAARREEALLYKKLATLVRDVPLPQQLGDLEWRGAPRERFEAFCAALGAPELRNQVPRWA